jgi:hypothetical protein
MKKQFLLLTALLINAVVLQAVNFSGGTGTQKDPYLVANAEQLDQVRNFPNSHFLQVGDINLNTAPFNMGNYWLPIGGNRSNNDTNNNFTGHYDGNGYFIFNLTVVQPGNSNVGLFGHIGAEGEVATSIKNVSLRNVIVIGGRGTGALVGRVTGNHNTRIENCSVEQGYVRGDAATGGLVGSHNSYMITSVAAEGYRPVIFKCSADVTVMLRSEFSQGKVKFGGLVGCSQKGMISNSFSLGQVHVNDKEAAYVGGLAGCIDLRGMIINSYASANVNADSTFFVGGLAGHQGVGRNKGIIYNSYWNKDVNVEEMPSLDAVALSEEQIKKQGSFENWDFNNIWNIQSNSNSGYPFFKAISKTQSEKTWTGLVSQSWSESENWMPEGAPSILDNIVLSVSGFNQPTISQAVTVNDIIIHDNVVLTLEGAQSSLTITGTLNPGPESTGSARITGEGAVVLAGSSLQGIPAMNFENLVIDNPNNVQLAGSIHVKGLLKMSQGLLDLRGFEINLGVDARLMEVENANVSSRVYGSSGVIRTVRELNKPSGDIGGMGLEIISNKDMGLTLIERGHSALNEGDESKSILRWFNIEPAVNQDLDATLVFHYFVSELNVYGENDNFSLFKRKHGDHEWVWILSELDANNQVLTAHNVNEFSTWTAGSTDKPLPIVLYSWEARAIDQAVELAWITAAEINNDYFTIERSDNGIDFEPIATVAGAGTSSRSNYYTQTDYQPLAGLSYYRLKQTDFNGQFEYSKTISVYSQQTVAEDFRVYPNPSNGRFNIFAGGERAVEYRIYDMQGRMIVSAVAEPGQISQVSLPQLKQGIYNVVFYSDELSTKKIQIL